MLLIYTKHFHMIFVTALKKSGGQGYECPVIKLCFHLGSQLSIHTQRGRVLFYVLPSYTRQLLNCTLFKLHTMDGINMICVPHEGSSKVPICFALSS